MPKVVVGPVVAFPEGSVNQVTVLGRKIAVFHAETGFFALRDSCPHQGAALSRGTVVGSFESSGPGCYEARPEQRFIRCPWHGWEYDLATGQSWFDPAHNRVGRYPASVVDGREITAQQSAEPGLAKGPYTVEPFTISIEDDYVVVHF
jgi:3-phenylpropionate/trans-cinnamate dioxygenase ferredoxin subunit